MISNSASSVKMSSPANWVGTDLSGSVFTQNSFFSYGDGLAGRARMTWSIASQKSNPTVERLRDEIAHFESNYRDGWDGPGTHGPTKEAVGAIRLALDAIPSGIVLPKTMLSPSGDIGLYWDFANEGYADLNADAQGCLSFFSRDCKGGEQFETVPSILLGAQWYWARVGRLSNQGNRAA